MDAHTALWDKLGKTDPAHTKGFSRAGGFKGTAIKPMFSYRRMTEEFGPCGEGWGINEPKFEVVPANNEILVFCTVSIWHGNRETIVFGVGGDKCLVSQSNGLRGDDEAFKKAFTDAVTNALKLIGVGADVHMGMFDDQKYVNTMNEEFGNTQPKPKPVQPPKPTEQEKVNAQRQTANEEKADKAVAQFVTYLSPMTAFEMVEWYKTAKPETVAAMKWVKAEFPDKWEEVKGLGFDVEVA